MRLAAWLQEPIAKRWAIHFKDIVVSRRNLSAIPLFARRLSALCAVLSLSSRVFSATRARFARLRSAPGRYVFYLLAVSRNGDTGHVSMELADHGFVSPVSFLSIRGSFAIHSGNAFVLSLRLTNCLRSLRSQSLISSRFGSPRRKNSLLAGRDGSAAIVVLEYRL